MELRHWPLAWKAPSRSCRPAPPQDLLNIKFSLNNQVAEPAPLSLPCLAMLLVASGGVAPAAEEARQAPSPTRRFWRGRACWAPQFGPRPGPRAGHLPLGDGLVAGWFPRADHRASRPACACARMGCSIQGRFSGVPEVLAQGQWGLLECGK